MTAKELRDALDKVVEQGQGDLPVMYYDDDMGQYVHVDIPHTVGPRCVTMDGALGVTLIVDIS